MKRLWKKRIEQQRVDFDKPYSYKDNTLKNFDIKIANEDLVKKIGSFKISIEEVENKIGDKIIEKGTYEVVFKFVENSWQQVLNHTLYEYTFDVDHGNEREEKNGKLVSFLYFDEEKNTLYIEAEDGELYCSIDGTRWFLQLLPFKKRPYYRRIKKLRKIKINYEI